MPTVVLDNLERRIAGNLSIPRNLGDLTAVLRADKHARYQTDDGPVVLAEGDVAQHLRELEQAGLVVRLGQHDDVAKLAASIERHKTARTMHDDKARIYTSRLQDPARSWRADGDLWIYTDEAHGMLTAPDPTHDRQLTRDEVERMIRAELDRVIAIEHEGSIFDLEKEPGDGLGGGRLKGEPKNGLANALLEQEYTAWAAAVAKAHEQRTGEKIRLPIAGGAGYGDATELLILAADTGGTAYGETSPTFGALTTVAVTDADTGSTITRATYTGYADKSIANTDYNSASAGAHTNANVITWAGATGGSSTVIGFARVTTSGGGRLVRYGTTASTTVSASNTPASIAAGSLSDTLD